MRKRLAIILALTAGLTIGATAPAQAMGGTKYCRTTPTQWDIFVGNQHPSQARPRTTCRFGGFTHRKLRKYQSQGKLRYRFGIKVRGKRMKCRVWTWPYVEIKCKSPVRFVWLIYSG